MTEVMMIDGTTEIATLRQKLAAAETRIQERGRDTATEADEDNAFKLFTTWKSEGQKHSNDRRSARTHGCASARSAEGFMTRSAFATSPASR
jgi:hypothetical protein